MARIASYLPPSPPGRLATAAEIRQRVLAVARAEIETTDPSAYFADAAPAFTDTSKDWCQVFCLWVLRQCGLTDWTHAIGGGWLNDLPRTRAPLPGDIELLVNGKRAKNIYHASIYAGETADGALVSIDGNTSGNSVKEKTRRAEWYSPRPVFYSIQPLIDAMLADTVPPKAPDTDPFPVVLP